LRASAAAPILIEVIEQEANLPVGNVPGLTELDLACGAMLGYDGRPSLPDPVTVADPEGLRRLIGSQLIPALATGRCLVPFSGGRDSSAILALSAETARRQGLPDPIPVTLRFPEASRGGEAQAQELVVRRLGLAEWERIDIQSELEVLGPTARGVLRRLGILFPSTAYTLVPMLERASGGTLVVGTGSSDFYLYWRWAKLADVLVGNRRPVRADARSVGTALLPGALRGALASPALRQDALATAEGGARGGSPARWAVGRGSDALWPGDSDAGVTPLPRWHDALAPGACTGKLD
jgi:asparagine synthase (glutamine-hydrolysing)